MWDVDPVAKRLRSFRRDRPTEAVEFGPGQQADAEPAVPGWSLAVDRIFA